MNYDFEDLLATCEQFGNLVMFDSFIKAKKTIDVKQRIVCAISGGADSDVVLDILTKLDPHNKIKYVWFNTGIETEATKRHLDYLESKYGIVIERIPAKIPVPLGCKKYGVPFWSKYVSEMIYRLQKHGFQWKDEDFETLYARYPACKGALRWWCNKFENTKHGTSKFNIDYVRGLKEYMTAFPPTFKISGKCCNGAKKDIAKRFLTEYAADLNILGIRKAEGGIRSSAYKSCFDPAKDSETWGNYRPIFWYSDEDRRTYEKAFDVKHSDCYCKYGLDRTGCAGCPFGKNFETELEIYRIHEPKLYKAINKIFGDSYEYTRRFLEFREGLTSK